MYGAAIFGRPCLVLSPELQNDQVELEKVRKRATKTVKGLEHLRYKVRLKLRLEKNDDLWETL